MEILCDYRTSETIILIVDDVPDNLRYLSCLLSQEGYDVRAAINGPTALTIAQSVNPSLILLDILMPQMDGYEVCRQLKLNPKTYEIPVIFLSALDDVANKINAFEIGGVDYVTKPFHTAEVLARVKTHLTLRNLQRDLQQANRELQSLVNVDGLTRVANRRCFDAYLEQEWNRLGREEDSLSLILCDVDFFKSYNDVYGHLAGDDCLCQIATILKQEARFPVDLVARYGGEEFAVILPNTPAEGAINVADKIRQELNRSRIPHSGSPISQYVTASLGVTTMIPKIGQFAHQIVAIADKALYQAKLEGRDRVCVIETATEIAH